MFIYYEIISKKSLSADAIFAIFPARKTSCEDITLFADESLKRKLFTWHGLRQQTKKPRKNKNKCLAESTPDGVHPTANSGGLRSDPAGA